MSPGTGITSRSDAPGVRIADLAQRYSSIRALTERLAAPLEIEDYQLQSMPDASPVKWHLAHTSWFFETFLLIPHGSEYRTFHPEYGYLFNSYYEAVGARHPRPQRGLLSRPTVREIYAYRKHVDDRMHQWFDSNDLGEELRQLVEIGLQHEQQHQELILTDLKHGFFANPLLPAYVEASTSSENTVVPFTWIEFPGGLTEIGHLGDGFAFDNETPRHKVYLEPFQLANRLVTVGEFQKFIADGGYRRPEFWLSDGWAVRQREGWDRPLYWLKDDDECRVFTLTGPRRLNPAEPVTHLSFYEADAFARWAGCRLPTEFEWERAAAGRDPTYGTFADDAVFHPRPLEAASNSGHLQQMFGDCWEWTASPYIPYPGYRPAAGAIGEYNGKFMCNQMVLRGGSCASPRGHLRSTYRNFFPPEARWQFSGIRLAQDVGPHDTPDRTLRTLASSPTS